MKTRYERRMARMTGVVRLLALAALLAVVLVTLSITGDEPPKETDRWAQYTAQEEYYRVVDLYGDTEGATDAARIVFEREADHPNL